MASILRRSQRFPDGLCPCRDSKYALIGNSEWKEERDNLLVKKRSGLVRIFWRGRTAAAHGNTRSSQSSSPAFLDRSSFLRFFFGGVSYRI